MNTNTKRNTLFLAMLILLVGSQATLADNHKQKGAMSKPALSLPVSGAAAASYAIDPSHTQVQFTYSHFGFSNITGRFDQTRGSFRFDPAHLEKSFVEAFIPISSISTGVAKLDEHLLTDEFFKNEQYPEAHYVSERIEAKKDGSFVIHGTLSLNGHKGHVMLNAKLNKQGEHPMRKIQAAGFDAEGSFLRSDFGLDKYVPNVGDEVTLRITTEGFVEAKKSKK